MTVFDPSTLHRLADGGDCRRFVLDLARTYQHLLGPRVERLTAAVAAVDLDTAMDAALSLKVSSSMTGALELADLAIDIEAGLRDHDLTAVRTMLVRLDVAARRADVEIERYLAAQVSTDSIR